MTYIHERKRNGRRKAGVALCALASRVGLTQQMLCIGVVAVRKLNGFLRLSGCSAS